MIAPKERRASVNSSTLLRYDCGDVAEVHHDVRVRDVLRAAEKFRRHADSKACINREQEEEDEAEEKKIRKKKKKRKKEKKSAKKQTISTFFSEPSPW